MKQVFRGYPQALAAAETGRKLMPYMVYKKDSQPPESGNAGRRKGTESEYLKGMYPLSVKRCQCLVEEACDRLDYSGSPMYDEYPDREFLYRVRDQIMKNAQDQGGILKQEAAIDASNVMHICGECGGVVRVRNTVTEEKGKKVSVRVCAKCGASLDAKKPSAKRAAKKAAKKKTAKSDDKKD